MRWLDALGVVLGPCRGSPILVMGDFNAISPVWDPGIPNDRGEPLLDWAAGLGLTLLNRGRSLTTFHPRGESAVDTSWASPGVLGMVLDWRVVGEAEILSDHVPILIELGRDEALQAGKGACAFPQVGARPFGPGGFGGWRSCGHLGLVPCGFEAGRIRVAHGDGTGGRVRLRHATRIGWWSAPSAILVERGDRRSAPVGYQS